MFCRLCTAEEDHYNEDYDAKEARPDLAEEACPKFGKEACTDLAEETRTDLTEETCTKYYAEKARTEYTEEVYPKHGKEVNAEVLQGFWFEEFFEFKQEEGQADEPTGLRKAATRPAATDSRYRETHQQQQYFAEEPESRYPDPSRRDS